jgi:putative transport protein
LSLFLSILLGHVIGRFHFNGVGFGSLAGTLVVGIIIGIIAKPHLPELLRWTFFYLFLFSIGYSIGPQFFGSLRRETLPQVALAGAQTCTPGFNALRDASGSNVGALASTAPVVVAIMFALMI